MSMSQCELECDTRSGTSESDKRTGRLSSTPHQIRNEYFVQTAKEDASWYDLMVEKNDAFYAELELEYNTKYNSCSAGGADSTTPATPNDPIRQMRKFLVDQAKRRADAFRQMRDRRTKQRSDFLAKYGAGYHDAARLEDHAPTTSNSRRIDRRVRFAIVEQNPTGRRMAMSKTNYKAPKSTSTRSSPVYPAVLSREAPEAVAHFRPVQQRTSARQERVSSSPGREGHIGLNSDPELCTGPVRPHPLRFPSPQVQLPTDEGNSCKGLSQSRANDKPLTRKDTTSTPPFDAPDMAAIHLREVVFPDVKRDRVLRVPDMKVDMNPWASESRDDETLAQKDLTTPPFGAPYKAATDLLPLQEVILPHEPLDRGRSQEPCTNANDTPCELWVPSIEEDSKPSALELGDRLRQDPTKPTRTTHQATNSLGETVVQPATGAPHQSQNLVVNVGVMAIGKWTSFGALGSGFFGYTFNLSVLVPNRHCFPIMLLLFVMVILLWGIYVTLNRKTMDEELYQLIRASQQIEEFRQLILDVMYDYEKEFDFDTPDETTCVEYFTKGRLLAVGSGIYVTVLDTESGSPVAIYEGLGKVTCLCRAQNEYSMYCGFECGVITYLTVDVLNMIVLDAALDAFSFETGTVAAIAVHPSELIMAAGGDDGSNEGQYIKIWKRSCIDDPWVDDLRLDPPAVIPNSTGNASVKVHGMFWPANGDKGTLVVGYQNHGSLIWDLRNNQPLNVLSVGRAIQDISPTGKYFLVPNDQKGFDIIDIKSLLTIATIMPGPLVALTCAQFVYSHDDMVLCGGTGKSAIWQVTTPGEPAKRARHFNHEDILPVSCVSSSIKTNCNGQEFETVATTGGRKLVLWRAKGDGDGNPSIFATLNAYIRDVASFNGFWAAILIVAAAVLLYLARPLRVFLE
ncbi:WD40-repeat-containing domain protein [Lyophyllum atratum]|nr:WD40-repeat-containing domain protein [Lyophyllum atratum]